jgi:hypothetical protein
MRAVLSVCLLAYFNSSPWAYFALNYLFSKGLNIYWVSSTLGR